MTLSGPDRLRLVQLQLQDWMESRSEGDSDERTSGRAKTLPERWELTHGQTLHPWQQDAVGAWFRSGKRGTIKVVTGAGKTMVALAVAERLQRDVPDLRIAIVVPTIVLMDQWRDVLLEHSNLPESAIGRLGGGVSDVFDEQKRVLIAVLASARKLLPDVVTRAGVGDSLLLVSDECHRVGAPEMSKVLVTNRAFSLGLSATPERDDEEASAGVPYEQTPVGQGLGPIVYEMTFAQAIELGVLPALEVQHYGLGLATEERQRYENLSRELRDARADLKARSSGARNAGDGEALLAWCRRTAARGDALSGLAARYVAATAARKDLLFGASARSAATTFLLQDEMASGSEGRVLLFHERVAEAQKLFEGLIAVGLPAVLEHGELPDDLRRGSLELFRTGHARIMVSVKALIEGLNVPEVDLGIIVASTTSVRQRIQSIGRVLRRHRTKSGEEKTARACVLYIRDTVDDRLYEKVDWDELLGVGRNKYFTWDPPSDPVIEPGPPRQRVPKETEIDVSVLKEGDSFPGRYDGLEFGSDTLGNVVDLSGRIARNPQGVPDALHRISGKAGRFKVTAQRQVILTLVKDKGEWRVLFAGTLKEPFQFDAGELVTAPSSVENLGMGQLYNGPLEPSVEYTFKRRGGGRIGKKVRRGELYASGAAADVLIAQLNRVVAEHGPVSRIFVNEAGDAFWRESGEARFLARLSAPLQFPAESES